MSRKITVCIMLLLAGFTVFAGALTSVKLDGVAFNGEIRDVGTSAAHAPVWITNSPSGSSYELVGAYITTLDVSGSGTVILNGCTVSGKTTVRGDVVFQTKNGTTLQEVDASAHTTGDISLSGGSVGKITVSGNTNVSLTGTTLRGDVEANGSFTGTWFTMTNGSLSNTPNITFAGRASLTEFRIENATGTLGKVDLSGATNLTEFNLTGPSSISEIDLSRVKFGDKSNTEIYQKINGRGTNPGLKNTWNVTTLKMANCGLKGAFSIDNAAILELDISGNNVGTGIATLNVNTELQRNNNLKTLNASNCSITEATIWMGGNLGPASGSSLDLSGNNLGDTYSTYSCTCKYEQSDSSYENTGTGLNTKYYHTTQTGTEDIYDDETGDKIGEKPIYTRAVYYNFRVGKALEINGNKITTHFDAGTDFTYDQVNNLAQTASSSTERAYIHLAVVKNESYDRRIQFRFDEEWTAELKLIDINLSGCGIYYKAGFKAQDETERIMAVGFRFWISKWARDNAALVGFLNAATKRNDQYVSYDVDTGDNFWECKSEDSNTYRYLYGNGRYSQNGGSQQTDAIWNTEVQNTTSKGYSSMRMYITHSTTWGDSIPRGLEETIYPYGQ